ncbi:MAG: PKD domain-containing protein [Taibaiella sp.]|nr:PKD domain-containing protein [Taibaiella sp.]
MSNFTFRLFFFLVLVIFSGFNAGATVSFTPSTTSGCAPLAVTFTNTSSSTTGSSWNFGGTGTSSLASPSWTFNTPGSYTVTLTIGSSSATATITVYDTPTVYFHADTAVCINSTVSFYDSSVLRTTGTATYYWQLAPSVTSTSMNPTYTYSTAGAYTIISTVTNSQGCKSVVSKPNYVHVYGHPSISFSGSPATICGTSGTVNFSNFITGGPSPFTYDWDFGDGTTHSTAANPTHSYSSPSYVSYTVTLITTSRAGCKDTVKQLAYINFTHHIASMSITPATTICAGTYIAVNNTSTPTATSTNWYFGDGATSATNPDVHQYSSAGTYTLKLVSSNGCSDSTTQTITVNPRPSVGFTSSPTKPCPAPININFTNNTTTASGTITSYQWSFGDGTGSATTAPSHTYNANGPFEVKLVATNSYGCRDSADSVAYINIYPLHSYITGNSRTNSFGACIPFSVNFSYTNFYDLPYSRSGPITYPYAVSSFDWDFGDTTAHSTTSAPSHTYTTYGIHRVILNFTTINGCTKSDTFLVYSGTPPGSVAFTANPTNACVDEYVHFTNTSTGATDYNWDFGNGSRSVDTSPVYKYPDSGTYTVKLIAYNNGCPDSFTRTRYIHVNLPRAGFDYNFDCSNAFSIIFTNLSKHSLTGTSYLWNFGDATTSTTASPTHTYAATGTYSVRLIVYDSTTGCRDTSVNSVFVENPIAKFTASDTLVCINTPVTFTGTLLGGSVAAPFIWRFDGTTIIDTTATINYTFRTTGYHSVKVFIKDDRGCTDTFSKYAYIGVAHPVAAFRGSPLSGCVPLTVYFTDSTTDIPGVAITSRYWDYGFSLYSIGSVTPAYTYTTSGVYYVSLAVKDKVGCTDTIFKSGYVDAHKPIANFRSAASAVCQGAPVVFYNSSLGIGLKSHWDFGDGQTSNLFFPSHAYTALGTYNVKLVVTDTLGCKDSMTITACITVVGKPTAAFTMDDSFKICAPLIVHFKSHSVGAVSITWYFGDPTATLAYTDSTNWTYVNAGVYTVMLVAKNAAGCTDTAFQTVHLLGYKGVLTYTPLAGCAPLTVSFTANISRVPSFIYDFGDGVLLRSHSTTASHTYTTAGAFLPKVIMTDDSGCSSESAGIDTIHVDGIYPGYSFFPHPACDSGTFEFLDTSSGAYSRITSHYWIFDDGTTSTSGIVFHTYHGPGAYPIILIGSTSTGCIDTFRSVFNVYSLPTINAGQDTTICVSDAATLMPSGGVSYKWSPKASLDCDSCTNPKASPTAATVYVVVGTDIHGCTNTDTVEVFIKTKTTSKATGGGEICQGESLSFHDSAGYFSKYNWVPPYALTDAHSPDPIANPDTSLIYLAIAQQGSCIPDTQYVNVIVHPRPTVSAGPNQTMIAGNTINLDAIGTHISRYAWYPAQSLSCDSCENPIAAPKRTTTYTIKVYSDFGCQDSNRVMITVICDHSQVYMPNTFTPNNDGQNDIYYPRGKGLQIIKSFRIYNRWGQVVFQKENFNVNERNNGWDGSFNGKPLNPDVFVYVVDAICDTGEPLTWKGDISLIR